MSKLMTNSGIVIDPFKPDWRHVDIFDIAHHLSLICRFNGACNSFYSVAEHSYILSYLVEGPAQLSALLHDAAEAYLGDIPTPIKQKLYTSSDGKPIKALELRWLRNIFKNLGIDRDPFWTIPKEVWDMDRALFRAEVREYFGGGAVSRFCERCNVTSQDIDRLHDLVVAVGGFRHWLPGNAQRNFVYRLDELYTKYTGQSLQLF